MPIIAPVEVTAIIARNYLEQQGLNRKDIGIFFITPCAAKSTYVNSPLGVRSSEIDGVISMQDIYLEILEKIPKLKTIETLALSSMEGVGWALSGGESKGVSSESIAVDGVENVEKVLDQVENGQLEAVDFIEGLACIGGCIAGPLTVTNSFVSKNRFSKIAREMEHTKKRHIPFDESKINYEFTAQLATITHEKLDDDIAVALEKMERMESIYNSLPHINCGSCGSPTCHTLAEDIVKGEANLEDCVFMLRKRVKELAELMYDLSSKIPQTLQQYDKKEEDIK